MLKVIRLTYSQSVSILFHWGLVCSSKSAFCHRCTYVVVVVVVLKESVGETLPFSGHTPAVHLSAAERHFP